MFGSPGPGFIVLLCGVVLVREVGDVFSLQVIQQKGGSDFLGGNLIDIDTTVLFISRRPGEKCGDDHGKQNGRQFGIDITYIQQEAPLGLAHAVLTAEEYLGDDSFVMYLGDNILANGIVGLVEEFQRAVMRAHLDDLPMDNEPWQFGFQ